MFNFFKWLLILKISKGEPEFARFSNFTVQRYEKILTWASKIVNIFQL